VSLPRRRRGAQSRAAAAEYNAEIAAFCERILQINSTLDFKVSSRGWAYLLEGEGEITKGDFDAAQTLINDCRKSGKLPLNICSEDDRRAGDGVEEIDNTDVDEEVDAILRGLDLAHLYYTPISFWDPLDPFDIYVEMAVEKVDLKSLFKPVCDEFHMVITNIGGWADLHCRVAMMRRFAEHEASGRRIVLLYCGDHDPGGLNISNTLRENLNDMERAAGWRPDNLIIDRFGLNFDFIQQNGLTWIDNLETGSGRRLDDPKHNDHHKPYVRDYLARFGARKVEGNALVTRAAAARDLCRQAIVKYVPASAPAAYRRRLALVRAELQIALDMRLGDRR
jgi:hypothetical protein